MAFTRQIITRGRSAALSGQVKAATISPKHKSVRLTVSRDVFEDTFGDTGRVDVHIGEGEDTGWVMLKAGSQLKPFKANPLAVSQTLTISGLDLASKSATVLCEHHVEGDELYVRIPFLKQPIAIAEAS